MTYKFGSSGGSSFDQTTTFLASHASTSRSLASRFTDLISVLDFGADPTGVADSTTAFQNAMAKGPVLVPSVQSDGTSVAIYRLNNCVPPNGAVLMGLGANAFLGGGGSYTTAGAGGMKPILAPLTSGTTRLFNVDGKLGLTFDGLIMDCSAVSGFTGGVGAQPCDAISAGGQVVRIRNCSIFYANHGVGGSVSGSVVTFPAASWITDVENCFIAGCIVGIGDLVDSWVRNTKFTGNQNGVLLDGNNQSSAITFTDCRFEWNGRTLANDAPTWSSGGYGLAIQNNATQIQIVGCEFDTNGEAGIALGTSATSGAFMINISGCYFQANGTNRVGGTGTTLIANSCHIFINNAFNITISSCTSRGDVNNDGVKGPAHWAHFVGTAFNNGGIVFANNDLSGYTGSTDGTTGSPSNSNTTWFSGTLPNTAASGLSGLVVKQNFGTGTAAQDVDTR